MSYLEKLLIPGEKVVLLARRHVLASFGDLIALESVLFLTLVGVFIASRQYPGEWVGWGLLTAAILPMLPLPFVAWRLVWWFHKVYVVTGLRVLKLEGVFAKDHRDAALDKINDVVLHQSLLGRILGFGHLQILTANEASGVTYHWLRDPVGFKRRVLESRSVAAPALPASLAAAPAEDPIAQLARLGELRDKGVVTEEEFLAKKKELMGRIR